jgi:molybdenum cofactor cytidylyltransferase
MKVSAVLLAAGSSSRAGKTNKLLLPFDGKPMFMATYSSLLNSIADEVIVVTGWNSHEIINLLDRSNPKLKVVFNPGFKNGMTSSVQTGIHNCATDSDAFMICLADMPFLTTADYNFIINAHQNNKVSDSILVPMLNNRQGNPVVFSSFYKNIILNHKSSEGCKSLLGEYRDQCFNIYLSNKDAFNDIDTLEMYRNLCLK